MFTVRLNGKKVKVKFAKLMKWVREGRNVTGGGLVDYVRNAIAVENAYLDVAEAKIAEKLEMGVDNSSPSDILDKDDQGE